MQRAGVAEAPGTPPTRRRRKIAAADLRIQHRIDRSQASDATITADHRVVNSRVDPPAL